MSDKNDNIEYDKSGKPTSASMKWAWENDRELFLDLQDKHFTTKSKMKENPFEGTVQEIFKKMKGNKDAK